MERARSYVGSYYQLDLDGINVGFVKSVEGGAVSAEVISQPIASQFFRKKTIGTPKYEPFTLEFDFGADAALFEWIGSAWKGNAIQRSGAIILADFNYKELSATEFFNALISEVTIPALDASSKEAAYFTVKIAPEYTRKRKGGGAKLPPTDAKKQKRWLPSNFRVTIGGLPCERVMKIDSFTVRTAAPQDDIGTARDYEILPTSIEFPNLVITLPESDAEAWFDWHEDFVIKGNNDESKEKSGTLEFLGADLKTVLGTIEFFNLGIFEMRTQRTEVNTDQIRRVKAGLYCERMEFNIK
jgi:phage tail-like protein